MNVIQSEIKSVSNKLHGLGFWVIIILVIGITMGISWNEHMFSKRIDDAILLGGMIHNGQVYDVNERVITQ